MARNLPRARHDKKLTQEEQAVRAGLSMRYIGAIERADVSASVMVLGRSQMRWRGNPESF